MAKVLGSDSIKGDLDALLTERRADSRTDYGWMKLGASADFRFPSTPYETVAAHAWETLLSRVGLSARAQPLELGLMPASAAAWAR